MWVMSIYGFYSIACADKPGTQRIDPETVMVRARDKKHLENLKKRFEMGAEFVIEECAHTDYRYRIVMPKAAWVHYLAVMAEEQTWRNFKKEAQVFEQEHKQTRGYVDALHEIWGIMRGLQKDGLTKPKAKGPVWKENPYGKH